MSPTDLIAELRAALDAEEAAVRALAEPHDWRAGPGDDPTWEDESTVYMWPPEFHTPYEGDKHWRGLTTSSPELAVHIARHDPKFVLADIAAKRAVLDLHVPVPGWDGRLTDRNPHRDPVCAICADYDRDGLPTGDPYPCTTLRLLAEAYGITEEERNA